MGDEEKTPARRLLDKNGDRRNCLGESLRIYLTMISYFNRPKGKDGPWGFLCSACAEKL